jgi:tRNA A-37 threonylcarbamoyl transferase component Bud32
MSNNGGTGSGSDEPTSFALQPPNPPAAVPHPGNPYAAPAQVVAPRSPAPAGPEPARAPAQEPGAGRLIAGRYRLVAKLGHGGMGTVWRAQDETVDREVAVKEPRVPDHLPERERANAYERMRREARAAARLDHPAVVDVHDVAVVDGRPWIVMELVRGRSLGDALQEGTLGAREAARIGLEVLGALEAAHAAGILHRDVKPDNVLLGRYDRVVLTDFGIAQIEGETNLTDTGGFVGSPEYIAPERVLGQRPGPASDLWSLGVVLYAATEGVSPFRRSNTPATLQSVLNAVPAPPASAQGPLAEVITGLLDKDPARAGSRRGPPRSCGCPCRAAVDSGSAAAVAGYLVVADPFAGPLPEGWKTPHEKQLAATLAVPAGYQRTVSDDAGEHWVTYTDWSGAIWIGLNLDRKAEDTGGTIAGSAAAEMYEDDGKFKESGEYELAMPENPTTYPKETTYKGGKSAENTVVYTTNDSQNPRPREVRIFYYRTTAGDMYKLTVSYPGKGDFTERGREVARTAVANLDIDGT